MCLIVFDWQPGTATPLRLAANRDEFHERPTQPLNRWPDAELIGGRDLLGGGTWLATGHSRLAALTNVRDAGASTPLGAPSRGELVRQALEIGDLPRWLGELSRGGAQRYAGFNLLVMAGAQMWTFHHSRHSTDWQCVPPGTHALSNARLDTPWPKVVRAREALQRAKRLKDWRDDMWTAMRDPQPMPADRLPDTGVGAERERFLSPLFIEGQTYGTRATTLVTATAKTITLEERQFAPNGIPAGEILRLTSGD